MPSSEVNEIRQVVKSQLCAENVDMLDLERLEQDDWFIERFLRDKQLDGDKDIVNSAASSIVKSLHWRKENKINDRRDVDFALAVHQKPGIIIDHDAKSLYIRVSFSPPFSDATEISTAYLLYHFEQFSQLVGCGQGTIVIDLKGAGVGNINVSVALTFIRLLTTYYPTIVSKLYLVDMMFLISPIAKMLIKFLPTKYRLMIEHVNRTDIETVLGDSTPTFLGGRKNLLARPLPSYLLSLQEIGRKNNLTDYSTERYRKFLDGISND